MTQPSHIEDKISKTIALNCAQQIRSMQILTRVAFLRSFLPHLILLGCKMAASKSECVIIPEGIAEEQKPWFVSFVKWFKRNYGAKLDPDNLCKVEPVNENEAIFLNFLKFFDKYIARRTSAEELEIFKERFHDLPNGTDFEFHMLAKTFVHYGPTYFENNSDVKGKTLAELQRMQKAKEWKTMYGSETAEFGYPVVNAKR